MKFTAAIVAAATFSSAFGWSIQWSGGSSSGEGRRGCENVSRRHAPFLQWTAESYGRGGALPPPTPFNGPAPGAPLPPPTPYGGSAFAAAAGVPLPPPGAYPPGPPPPAILERQCKLELFPRRDCDGPRQTFDRDFTGNINFDWRSYKVRCERY